MGLVHNENCAYIKEVGWKRERMSLSLPNLHVLLIAYKTFMHVGIFLLTCININIEARDKPSRKLFLRGDFQNCQLNENI